MLKLYSLYCFAGKLRPQIFQTFPILHWEELNKGKIYETMKHLLSFYTYQKGPTGPKVILPDRWTNGLTDAWTTGLGELDMLRSQIMNIVKS